jgi:hypothetical protein
VKDNSQVADNSPGTGPMALGPGALYSNAHPEGLDVLTAIGGHLVPHLFDSNSNCWLLPKLQIRTRYAAAPRGCGFRRRRRLFHRKIVQAKTIRITARK